MRQQGAALLEPTQMGDNSAITIQFGDRASLEAANELAARAPRRMQMGEGDHTPRQMGDQTNQYPHLTKLLGRDPSKPTPGVQHQTDHWDLRWEETKLAQQMQMTSDF
jgi:hypothetical protein